MGALADAASSPVITERRCRFGTFIERLDEDDLEWLDQTNPDGSYVLTNVWVHEFTKNATPPYPVSADVIGRHRTGRCVCNG